MILSKPPRRYLKTGKGPESPPGKGEKIEEAVNLKRNTS